MSDVPADYIKTYQIEMAQDLYEREHYKTEMDDYIHEDMAIALGRHLLKAGFIKIEILDPPKGSEFVGYRHRATIKVVTPDAVCYSDI